MKRPIHLSIDVDVLKEARKKCLDYDKSLSEVVERLLVNWATGGIYDHDEEGRDLRTSKH